VLRRQQLQFFVDESEAEAAGPEEVELLGCICGKDRWRPLSGYGFLVYKPVRDATNAVFATEFRARTEEKYEFGVDTEREQRRWMFLMQEATQISESWSRILSFYERLHSATSVNEYVQSIKRVASDTMVIPLEWVRQRRRRREGGTGRAASDSGYAADLAQANKDLLRDCVNLDGRILQLPRVDDPHLAAADDIATEVLLRILKWARQARPEDELLETKAMMIARDVALRCSRTDGNGDTLEAVEELFKQEDLVHTLVDQQGAEPICVRVLRPDGAESVLQQDFLRATDCGLPQFESDPSATNLGIEKVRSMCMEADQRLQVTNAGQDTWVPDWEMIQCMRCGVQFRTWVRRHHCRKCGALICASCSQHSVELVTPGVEDNTSKKPMGRVCFLCYQRAVIDDLSARKGAGATQPEEVEIENAETTDESAPTAPAETRTDMPSSHSLSLLDEGAEWPVVNIEMTSRYRLTNMDLEELFLLNCRYVRQVRWSGVADAGRIMISIEQRQ